MRVTFHKNNSGDHIWTVQDTDNWKIIGASTEGYRNKQDCIANFEMLTGLSIKGFGVQMKGQPKGTDGVALALNDIQERHGGWEVQYDD